LQRQAKERQALEAQLDESRASLAKAEGGAAAADGGVAAKYDKLKTRYKV
jgi:hypothetical protein